MEPQINISLPEGVSQSWQSVQDFVNQGVNSAQQVGQSWQETAINTTNKAINNVTTNIDQAKDSLAQFKNTTSGAIESAIASSINHLLTEYPAISRLLHLLNWAVSHPIISVLTVLFSLAILWGIINAILRLLTTASFSLLTLPIKVITALFKFSYYTFNKITNYRTKANELVNIPNIYQYKQQRLVEISSRLEAIQQEQKKLLEEATKIINTDKV